MGRMDGVVRARDIERLKMALGGDLGPNIRESFQNLLEEMERGDREQLGPKLRAKVTKAIEAQEPEYKNLASTGKVKVNPGRVTEVPWMLRPENLPKKPPGRK